MMSLLRKPFRRKVSAGLVALAVVVSALLLVALNPLTASTATTSADHGAATTAADGSEQLRATLAILRRPAVASDALPSTAREGLASLHLGADATRARRAFVSPGGVGVYVVPSEQGVCLVDSDLSEAGCFPVGAVLGSGATQSDDCSPTLPNGHTIEIAGIIPDGATHPTLILSDGSRRPLKVVDNAYLEQLDRSASLPTHIEWQSATGSVTVNADVPADVAGEQCATPGELRALEAAGKIPRALGHPPARPTGETVYNEG
jgi:hypothetical protein